MPATDKLPQLASLYSTFEAANMRVKRELNCARVGTVKAFRRDGGQALCTFELGHEVMIATPSGMESILMPPLNDVPVIFIEGDGVGIFYNLKVGDEVLGIITDRQLDAWVENGGTVPLDIGRFHALSDIVVIAGIRSKKNVSSVVPGPGTLYLGDTNDATAHIRINSTAPGTVTAEGTAIKLGTAATKGAARVSDPVSIPSAAWLAFFNGLILATPPPGQPGLQILFTAAQATPIGTILSGSTKTVIE